MKIDQRVVGGLVVFGVSGAYTHRDAGALRTMVDQALRVGARNIVLDLEGLSDLGGAGLGELVSIYAAVRRAAGRLGLSAVPGRIRYLLAAAGLDAVFTMADSYDSAATASPPQSLSSQVAQGRSSAVYGGTHDATGVPRALADRVQVCEAVGNQGLAVAGQAERP